MIEIDIKKKLSSSDGEMTLSLNQSIEKGEFIGLYGPSGAGKTSTPVSYTHLTLPTKA